MYQRRNNFNVRAPFCKLIGIDRQDCSLNIRKKNPTCQFLDFGDFSRTELRERGTPSFCPSHQVKNIFSAKPRTRGAERKTSENTTNKIIHKNNNSTRKNQQPHHLGHRRIPSTYTRTKSYFFQGESGHLCMYSEGCIGYTLFS